MSEGWQGGQALHGGQDIRPAQVASWRPPLSPPKPPENPDPCAHQIKQLAVWTDWHPGKPFTGSLDRTCCEMCSETKRFLDDMGELEQDRLMFEMYA